MASASAKATQTLAEIFGAIVDIEVGTAPHHARHHMRMHTRTRLQTHTQSGRDESKLMCMVPVAVKFSGEFEVD